MPADEVVTTGVMTVLAFHKEGVVLSLAAAPRAGSTEFGGLEGERLRVRQAAPPVDGAANEAPFGF